MKYFLIAVSVIFLTSCDEPEYRWKEYGALTSLRIDDDSEYHFSTDNYVVNDMASIWVSIDRGNYQQPKLFLKEKRCPEGKSCSSGGKEWSRVPYRYLIQLPKDYKIETFDD